MRNRGSRTTGLLLADFTTVTTAVSVTAGSAMVLVVLVVGSRHLVPSASL